MRWGPATWVCASSEVEKVKVTIAKVYANNIQQLLRSGQQYGYPEYAEDELRRVASEGEDGEYVDRSLQLLRHREHWATCSPERTISVDRPAQGRAACACSTSTLKDLEFTGPMKGLYVVRVQDTERQWLQVSKLVAVIGRGPDCEAGAKAAARWYLPIPSARLEPLAG
ncbi:MAG: hypothetical protein WKG07_27555 [Hymenobacter sp.]